jgi:hypothetical protein
MKRASKNTKHHVCLTVEDQFAVLAPKPSEETQIIRHSCWVALTSVAAESFLETDAYLFDFVNAGSLQIRDAADRIRREDLAKRLNLMKCGQHRTVGN